MKEIGNESTDFLLKRCHGIILPFRAILYIKKCEPTRNHDNELARCGQNKHVPLGSKEKTFELLRNTMLSRLRSRDPRREYGKKLN